MTPGDRVGIAASKYHLRRLNLSKIAAEGIRTVYVDD